MKRSSFLKTLAGLIAAPSVALKAAESVVKKPDGVPVFDTEKLKKQLKRIEEGPLLKNSLYLSSDRIVWVAVSPTMLKRIDDPSQTRIVENQIDNKKLCRFANAFDEKQ